MQIKDLKIKLFIDELQQIFKDLKRHAIKNIYGTFLFQIVIQQEKSFTEIA